MLTTRWGMVTRFMFPEANNTSSLSLGVSRGAIHLKWSIFAYLTHSLRQWPLRSLRLLEPYDPFRMWLLQFLMGRPNLSVDHFWSSYHCQQWPPRNQRALKIVSDEGRANEATSINDPPRDSLMLDVLVQLGGYIEVYLVSFRL